MPSALISGASVAGPALAYWLMKAGFDVTVVERSAEPRLGGQAIDIRGPAITVIEKMGLLDAVSARRTHHKGMTIVDRDGVEMSRTTERTASAGRLNSGDIEIFKDDLTSLLLEATASRVEYRYGDSIQAIQTDTAKLAVTFRQGTARHFDFAFGADGMRSNVRRLVFGEDAAFLKPLGIGFAIYTAPNVLGLEDWQISHRGETQGYLVYPSRLNADLRVNLGFALEPEEFPRGDRSAQNDLIKERSAGLGGVIPELLNHITTAKDLWFGPLAQVHMPHWSHGRVALVGDAAYCPTPFTGQGTSLALVGAYVLGKALARHAEAPDAAFAFYEQKMRPFVTMNQALLDLNRQGPVPDDEFDRAKNGIDLTGL